MRSGTFRKFVEAAAAEGASPELWEAIAEHGKASADSLMYFDAVHILQAFTSARVQNDEFFISVAHAMCSKTSRLAPKHVLDLFAVYEANNLRPRAFYVELFHALIRLTGSMYAEELSMTLQAMARYQIGNPTALAHVVRAMRSQLREFRLRYLCSSAGALGVLGVCPPALFAELDARARFEVETIAVQELLDNLQAFPSMEFSWKPYEDLCLAEFMTRIRSFKTAHEVGGLADPFGTLYFLRARGLLEPGYLEALSQWCLLAVHQPNVRSHRRPTAKQLATLHDWCLEYKLENEPALQDAIQYFVESGGGRWPADPPQPLRYRKKRTYHRTADPLEDAASEAYALEARGGLQVTRAGAPPMMDLPGLPGLGGLAPQPETRIVTKGAINHKPSAGESVTAWITSRRGPRPRRPIDPGFKKMYRKDHPRMPLWLQGGWRMRPKYQTGVATKKYPWAGVPNGKLGAAWVLRR